jgi:hypothetical protein
LRGVYRELGPLLRHPQPSELVQRANCPLQLSEALFRFFAKALCFNHGQPGQCANRTYKHATAAPIPPTSNLAHFNFRQRHQMPNTNEIATSKITSQTSESTNSQVSRKIGVMASSVRRTSIASR